MPAPTDLLNDDVKELKGEMRDIRSNLEVLKADVHRIDVSLAELRSDVRGAIGTGKWAATVLVTLLLTSGIGAIIWGARLDAKVSAMESRASEKFQEVGSRLDKMEAAILRAIERDKAAPAKPGP